MLQKASFGKGLRCAAAAAKVAGACLGVAVIGSSLDPETVLAMLAVALLVVGGVTWSVGQSKALPLRILASVATVVLARWAGGPAAAALAAALLALGAWLRIGPAQAVGGLALFGAAVALLGRASLHVLVGFWLVGLAFVLLRLIAVRAWHRLFHRASLRIEKTEPVRAALRTDPVPASRGANDLQGSPGG